MARWAVVLAIAVGTVLRLFYVFESIGTNDVRTWFRFFLVAREHGIGPIYELLGPGDHPMTFFNHPPLMAAWLMLIEPWVTEDVERFPMLMRLPATVSDIGTALCVYGLAAKFRSARVAAWSCAVVALSPVLIWVSGFHGNTDPVFVFLILLSVYLLTVRRSVVLAGIALGLSLNIKIVPLITLPVFFAALTGWRQRVHFFGAVGAVFLVGYGYHFLFWFETIWRNVFAYSSWPGLWGLSQLASDRWTPGLTQAAKVAIAAMIIARAAWALVCVAPERRSSPEALTAAIGWAFLIFLIMMPGFGVQYLSWFAAPAVLLSLAGGVVYNLLASVFLFGVYSFWAGGSTLWHFAQAQAWPPFWMSVGLVLWTSLVGLAFWLSLAAFRQRR